MNNLGIYLKNARENIKISQRELATNVNVSKSYINKIENEKTKKPSAIILIKIAIQLNLDVFDVLEKAGYTDEEIKRLGIINNIKMNFKISGIEKEAKFETIDKFGNKHIDLIKVLNGYQNKLINLEETIGLLSCITNLNLSDYISDEDKEKYNINIIKGFNDL